MEEYIKVITIWQPWASLLAYGHKAYETRTWKTSYTGPILIHSARKWDIGQHQFYEAHARQLLGNIPLSKGKILATAELVDCVPIDEAFRRNLSRQEILFGEFADGRYAWVFENVVPLEHPLRWKGMQGMWQIEYEKFMDQVNFGEMEW